MPTARTPRTREERRARSRRQMIFGLLVTAVGTYLVLAVNASAGSASAHPLEFLLGALLLISGGVATVISFVRGLL